MLYSRYLADQIAYSLQHSPVVLVNGARQSGKSTLAQELVKNGKLQHYVTLDDPGVLSALTLSPEGYLKQLPVGTVIDEVQRWPQMFQNLKKIVDEERVPGRFLLTGSANVLMLPKLSDSLAGRMQIFTLRPLAQAEIVGSKVNFIDRIFADELNFAPSYSEADIPALILRGGCPNIVLEQEEQARSNWFQGYVTTLLQRDVRDLAQIEQIGMLPNLLQLLADRVGGVLNYSDLARISGVKQSTLKRYLHLFEALFFINYLPAWFSNLGKALAKSPKVYLNDTGLACYLLGDDVHSLAGNRNRFGFFLENFVLGELRKQASWAEKRISFAHLRANAGQEVDCILQSANGKLVGIEMKAAEVLKTEHLKGLKWLRQQKQEQFQRGILLYQG